MMICSKFKGAGGSTPSYEMETPTVGLLPRLPHRALTLVGSAEQERKEKKRKEKQDIAHRGCSCVLDVICSWNSTVISTNEMVSDAAGSGSWDDMYPSRWFPQLQQSSTSLDIRFPSPAVTLAL